ncbi:type IV pilus modification PilV family protein [Aporhodopirellula aestuarii]|uniref:Prepilin-type N-terminal cleavage/methylation domain-containing protein n=1 Tax=Aporhodopirellula aestuarii TaxID=2950107 RepID=A0ABT0U3U1_9BACT|nr:prepilin-type N-terminal cleavage/methylation domain-containing protein [Aporhodopirellula aestuarii]MCM2371535.1 prepilin-type N-terminal cleavage/methylation domain-containing protein [Aporhodopirellula aestuarii]
MKKNQPQLPRRRGVTMIECVVAASILLVAMSTVTTMAFRVNRVWIDVADQRIAMNELANAIESITALPAETIDDAIKELQPSATATASLDQPQLSGIRMNDELGDRVVLTLTWRSTHPLHPVQLIGWIDPPEATP